MARRNRKISGPGPGSTRQRTISPDRARPALCRCRCGAIFAMRTGSGHCGALLRGARRNVSSAAQLAMDPRDPFDLALGRETLVKAFVAEGPNLLAPGGKPLAPALHP